MCVEWCVLSWVGVLSGVCAEWCVCVVCVR